MKVNKEVKKYIQRALEEKINELCPGYGQATKERVIAASMDGLHVKKETLYRAIELAISDKRKADDDIFKWRETAEGRGALLQRLYAAFDIENADAIWGDVLVDVIIKKYKNAKTTNA